MHQPGHGPVEHSTLGSSERHAARGFTASYGWASGNPHHVPRFHMSGYQRPVARVDQKYGEQCVVRAPYASDNTSNDLPLHNHIANAVPQFHMSCYERGANVHPTPDAAPYLPGAEKPREPPVTTSRRPNAAPTQNWMNWKDSSLCDPRNEAKANTIISPRNNSQHIGTIMGDFQDARGEAVIGDNIPSVEAGFQPGGRDAAHVPHAAPPQSWASGYDSSLNRARNHDSELSSIMPRKTTAAQGTPSTNKTIGTGPVDECDPKRSHSSPMGHQPWASDWDSALCRKWQADPGVAAKYTSNVADLIHGGGQ